LRKLSIAVLAVGVAVVPAQAKPPAKHPKPAPKTHVAHPKRDKCAPHAHHFKASGLLVSESLTQTAGTGTPKRGDDRYSGTVTVDVKKANHGAPTGTQTYTLDNDRVKFYDRDHNHVADDPQAGDRVKVKGKITHLRKGCDSSGFTPTIDVRSVGFKPPKPAKHAHH
jgi:hypothetical protein